MNADCWRTPLTSYFSAAKSSGVLPDASLGVPGSGGGAAAASGELPRAVADVDLERVRRLGCHRREADDDDLDASDPADAGLRRVHCWRWAADDARLFAVTGADCTRGGGSDVSLRFRGCGSDISLRFRGADVFPARSQRGAGAAVSWPRSVAWPLAVASGPGVVARL